MTGTVDSTTRSHPLSRRARATLAAAEYVRFLDLVRTLKQEQWTAPTECPGWDVRAMTAHMLGMMEFAGSIREFLHVTRRGRKAARGRPMIDGMTEVQVAERAHLTVPQLLDSLAAAAPRAVRNRARLPAPLRLLPVPHEIDGVKEVWRLSYLFDVVLTRDTWMHRVDISRATGQELVLTAEHDGRLVTDVVQEWARRHGQPYRLTLLGPAGGAHRRGTGGEEITMDAVEFCRTLSGRSPGTGLLSQLVPF
jgi:uncharacterized protein (TIGR03083 family)